MKFNRLMMRLFIWIGRRWFPTVEIFTDGHGLVVKMIFRKRSRKRKEGA